MAKHPPDLFKTRSATQEFLFSHSDDTADGTRHLTDATAPNRSITPLSEQLADMLDGQALIDAIDTRLASAPILCAIALDLERTGDAASEEGNRADFPTNALIPLAARSRAHGGVWGRIGRDRFVGVLPHVTVAVGEALAHDLLREYAGSEGLRVTVGLAVYPTINYARRQIVENVEKALEHGTFFGPGTVTVFDAVSLNISGDRHYQAGDIAGAIDEFKRGLLIDPTDANLHNSLGVCHGVLKDYDQALAAFDTANWLAPHEVMAIYNKGYVMLLQGHRNEALACFLKADAREPNVFEVVFHIGQLYMEMEDADHARFYLEAATRSNGRSGPAFKSLGACLDKLDLTKEAIQAYKSAVKINPEDAESLSILGQLYTQRGESLDVAAVFCAQSVRLDPENGLFRHRLGMVYLNQGKLEDANAEFESALALGHDSHAALEGIQSRMLAAKAS